jgi:glycine cleavage system H protein
MAAVESVKAASDVYAPVSGTVTAANAELAANPALVNSSAEDKAWFVKLEASAPKEADGMLDAKAYAKVVEASKH